MFCRMFDFGNRNVLVVCPAHSYLVVKRRCRLLHLAAIVVMMVMAQAAVVAMRVIAQAAVVAMRVIAQAAVVAMRVIATTRLI